MAISPGSLPIPSLESTGHRSPMITKIVPVTMKNFAIFYVFLSLCVSFVAVIDSIFSMIVIHNIRILLL